MITHTNNWLRDEQIQIILKEDEYNVAKDFAFVVGGATLGATIERTLGGEGSTGGLVGGAIGFVISALVNGSAVDLQKKRNKYLNTHSFCFYKIVRGEDLAEILEISSPGAQKQILERANLAQLQNAVDKIKDIALQESLRLILVRNPIKITEDERIQAEKKAIAQLKHNLNRETSQKCEALFGELYPKIATHILGSELTKENVHKIHAFAKENELTKLEVYCENYFHSHSAELFFESKKTA